MSSVLLTDSQQRKTLSVMRSLGQRGIKSDCCDPFRYNLTRFSKYCRNFHMCPSPTDDAKGFLDFLQNFVSKQKDTVLFPMDDDTIKIVVDNRAVVEEKCKVVIPPTESFYLALKKDLAVKHAQEKGIPCPLSLSSHDYEEIEKAVDKMTFPVIIKPVDSSGSRGMQVVESRQMFKERYDQVHADHPFPVVQEFLSVSQKIDVCLIYNRKSQLRGCFVQKELRNYPNPIGPATVLESILHEEAKELAIKFMEGLNWQGIVELEFIVDKASNTLVFMEVNPRFWASLELAVQAGVDFPYMYYSIAGTGDCQEALDYEVGKKVKWSFPGEILAFFEAEKKIGSDPSFFSSKGIVDDTFSLKDPKPIFGLFMTTLYYLTNRKRRQFILRR